MEEKDSSRPWPDLPLELGDHILSFVVEKNQKGIHPDVGLLMEGSCVSFVESGTNETLLGCFLVRPCFLPSLFPTQSSLLDGGFFRKYPNAQVA